MSMVEQGRARGSAPRRAAGALMVAAGVAAFLALPEGPLRLVALGMSAGLTVLTLVRPPASPRPPAAPPSGPSELVNALASDPVPVVVTDVRGVVLAANPAGCALAATGRALTLPECEPDLNAILEMAGAIGHAEGRAADPRGARSVAVLQVAGGFLWRLPHAPDDDVPEGDRLYATLGREGRILSLGGALRGIVKKRPRTLSDLIEAAGDDLWRLRGGADGRLFRLRETALSGGRRRLTLVPTEHPAGIAAREVTADLEEAFAAMPVALIAIRGGGFVYAGNARARALLAHDLQGAPHLRELVGGLGRSIGDWVDAALEGRGLGQPEVLRARLPDAETYVQVTFGRVLRDGATVVIAHLSDATEFKTLEAQFVQGQKMQAIGQLAGGVAHDFNNLLTAISGHCDLLLLRRDQHDPDYADLVQINQNANRAAGLVAQLLAFSRKQNLQPEVLDVGETLSELTHLLNRLVGERVTLTLTPAAEVGCIRADRRQMEQVLMNLVVNARDALGAGGAIRIEAGDLDLTEPLARDNAEVPPGAYVELRVSDEGCGIPPDRIGKIFEPFWTTKRPGEGTGLGLSTVYGIVKQTGGFIFVDSTVGAGTTFQLLFPRHAAGAPAPKPAEETEGEAGGDGVILLVEDEAPVRNFASRALQLQGYEVIEAESAESALELLEDPALQIDLFVTDVIMPGLDGPSWVRRAHEDRPDARVVFVSGYAEDALEGAAGTIPGSVFLPKPFSLDALSRTVAVQLEGRGRRAGLPAPSAEVDENPAPDDKSDLLTAASRDVIGIPTREPVTTPQDHSPIGPDAETGDGAGADGEGVTPGDIRAAAEEDAAPFTGESRSDASERGASSAWTSAHGIAGDVAEQCGEGSHSGTPHARREGRDPERDGVLGDAIERAMRGDPARR